MPGDQHAHPHDHAHPAHGHAPARRARTVPPRLSLLRLSVLERLCGVGLVLAGLWAGLAWAIG